MAITNEKFVTSTHRLYYRFTGGHDWVVYGSSKKELVDWVQALLPFVDYIDIEEQSGYALIINGVERGVFETYVKANTARANLSGDADEIGLYPVFSDLTQIE